MWVFLVFDRLHLKWPRGKIYCPLWAWVHYLQRQWRLQQHTVPLSFWTAEDVCWWWHQKSLSGFWWSWGRIGENVSENHEHAYWVPPWMTWTGLHWSFLSFTLLLVCLLACLLSFMLLDIEFKASVCWVVLYHWAVSPTFSLSLTSCGLTFDIPLQLRHCSLIFRMALGLSWFCFLFISVS